MGSKEAEPYCKRSVSIFQKTVGTRNPLYSIAVLNYASLLENTGRTAEATKLKKLVEQLQNAPEDKKK